MFDVFGLSSDYNVKGTEYQWIASPYVPSVSQLTSYGYEVDYTMKGKKARLRLKW